MKKIIAIANQKGGVGKTTSTISLGAALTKLDKKVLLIDFDPQGNLTHALGNKNQDKLKNTIADLMKYEILDKQYNVSKCIRNHEEGMSYIPCNINLAAIENGLINTTSREYVLDRILSKVKKDYDYILIDCMPSLGILSINALTTATDVIIPVQAEYLSTEGVKQLVDSIRSVKRKLNRRINIEGLLITMTDDRTNLSKIIETKIKQEFGKSLYVYKKSIPRAVRVAESSVIGQSILAYNPKSKAALSYMDVAKEVVTDEKRRTCKENEYGTR